MRLAEVYTPAMTTEPQFRLSAHSLHRSLTQIQELPSKTLTKLRAQLLQQAWHIKTEKHRLPISPAAFRSLNKSEGPTSWFITCADPCTLLLLFSRIDLVSSRKHLVSIPNDQIQPYSVARMMHGKHQKETAVPGYSLAEAGLTAETVATTLDMLDTLLANYFTSLVQEEPNA